MRVSTAALVEATIKIKERSDASVGWPLAAIKAIESKGIFYPPDIVRRKMDVITELRRMGKIPTRKPRHAGGANANAT